MKNFNYVKIRPDFKPEDNFWEVNPQVAYVEPFNKLYKIDDGQDLSSAYMWACYFNNYPDESLNFLFRYSQEKRDKALLDFYPDLDLENELYLECNEAFPFACLNSIQRALKEELDSLKVRARKLRDTPYTFDHYWVGPTGDYILDKSEKPIMLKGSAKDIDAARAKTAKIYEGVEQALEKFMEQAESEARVYGGREQTAHEKGLL